jgi:hypothetical protein
MKIRVKLLAVVAIAAASLLGLGHGLTGSAMASTGPLHLRIVKIPVASLSSAARARLTAEGVSPAGFAFEIVSIYGYCLDANDSGPTAGEDGDKIQLWTCNDTDNQFWYAGTPRDGAGSYALINAEYTSKCLNADDNGLGDGSHVQLWSCGVGGANMYWDLTGWGNCLKKSDSCPIYLQSDNYKWVLDATAQDIGKGDQIQIWTPTSGDNQDWVNE